MRLDLDLPDERRRPRDLEMPEVPVVDGIAEVRPPPPPDALALRMERNEELSTVNSFPKIPSPPHEGRSSLASAQTYREARLRDVEIGDCGP